MAADSRWDAALRGRYRPGGFPVVLGASYQNEPFAAVDECADDAISGRHEPTGLNLATGGASGRLDRGTTSISWIVRLGRLAVSPHLHGLITAAA